MKFFRIWCEFKERPELNEYVLYAFMDEEAGREYIKRNYHDVVVEEIKALPQTDMHFTPLFELCAGMYAIRKGMFGKWDPEDFEEVEINASMAV